MLKQIRCGHWKQARKPGGYYPQDTESGQEERPARIGGGGGTQFFPQSLVWLPAPCVL